MKEILITISIVTGLLAASLFFFKDKLNYVTSEQFEEAHEVLNKKIDSMQLQLNNVEKTVNRMDFKLDSALVEITDLKDGQEVIYYEVTNSPLSFWQSIYKLRKNRLK